MSEDCKYSIYIRKITEKDFKRRETIIDQINL